MISDETNWYTYHQVDLVKLECSINLSKLLLSENERSKFYKNWKAFLDSDSNNNKIFKLENNRLTYYSEQLIPAKVDNRPPLLLVLGNPASHSVHAGMFFAFEGNRKEHRFWKYILQPAGILELPKIDNGMVDKLNGLRKQQLLDLAYGGPFRLGLCVFISMPSASGGKWGGIAGVQKLIGVKALRRLEIEETRRIHDCAQKFIGQNGKTVIFQKNAWNALRSRKDPEYRIDLAKKGLLQGRLKNVPGIEILGVPPTRLSGLCSRTLGQLTKSCNCGKRGLKFFSFYELKS